MSTVVSGVRREGGRAFAVRDPRLSLRGGGGVPFLPHDKAYKHMGNMRCAASKHEIGLPKLEFLLTLLEHVQSPGPIREL